MDKNWLPPEGHPISIDKAKKLLAGDILVPKLYLGTH
jgi:hypothetical protein